MSASGVDNRPALIAKLRQSREEIRLLLDPPPPAPGAPPGPGGLAFPRSRTMRALLSGKGLGTVGAVAGGLLVARPAIALRLLRLVPATAVGKMLLARTLSAMRDKYRPPR